MGHASLCPCDLLLHPNSIYYCANHKQVVNYIYKNNNKNTSTRCCIDMKAFGSCTLHMQSIKFAGWSPLRCVLPCVTCDCFKHISTHLSLTQSINCHDYTEESFTHCIGVWLPLTCTSRSVMLYVCVYIYRCT